MPINQPPSTNAHSPFFSGSNQSHVQFISPNNQNAVFANNLNAPSKPDHVLPSFISSNGAQQPIYLFPQYGSQLQFYGQNQPRIHHQPTVNDTDNSQHKHAHQAYSAQKPTSTQQTIGNSTNGKSPAELDDERHSPKKSKASNQTLPYTPDINAASTILHLDHKTGSSDSKKDVMSIENLSAPLVT